jgi:predicted permease
MWDTPRAVATHPWFIATMFDAYFGFLTFFCWVAYKETSNLARVVWLVAILLLGNIAMSVYMLLQLFRLPANAGVESLLLRKK